MGLRDAVLYLVYMPSGFPMVLAFFSGVVVLSFYVGIFIVVRCVLLAEQLIRCVSGKIPTWSDFVVTWFGDVAATACSYGR